MLDSGSLYMAIEAAEAAGHEVVLAACILDRRQGGGDRLHADGYAFPTVLVSDDEGRVGVA